MTENPTSNPAPPSVLSGLTAEIVAAYVAHNSVPATALPGLIGDVHAALCGLGTPKVEAPPAVLKPAVPVAKSITPDFLISLEDGRKLKSMKRYLAGLGMTPEQYRTKWGLPPSYPMVAPNYSAHRTALAKTMGLGTRSVAKAA